MYGLTLSHIPEKSTLQLYMEEISGGEQSTPEKSKIHYK
jgi:hypothetical protein